MIKLTDPEHGWMVLTLEKSAEEIIEIDFSDVGPNSVKELDLAVSNLEKGDQNVTINFYLEPSIAKLEFSKFHGELKIEYYVNGSLKKSFCVNEKKLIDEFNSQLKRVIPLCKDQQWTQEII